METSLVQPDEVIINQFEDGANFYIIAKGECTVRVGEEKIDVKNEKKLRFGDYFGEISLIYGCKTTAKIIARKYCNLATLNKHKFEEVLLQFPGLKETL
jgi:CRP-like cAMP-binding protein